MSPAEELAKAVLEGRVSLEVTSQTDPRWGHVSTTSVRVVVAPAASAQFPERCPGCQMPLERANGPHRRGCIYQRQEMPGE